MKKSGFIKALIVGLGVGLLNWDVAYAGPIIIRNGTGESEFNLVFTHGQLSTLMKLCRSTASCANELTPGLQSEFEFLSGAVLHFQNSEKMGETTSRIDRHQSAIYLNQDYLWVDDTELAFTLDESLRFLLRLIDAPRGFEDELLRITSSLTKQSRARIDQYSLRLAHITDGRFGVILDVGGKVSDARTYSFKGAVNCLEYSDSVELSSFEVGNINYSYKVDREAGISVFFNSEVTFVCGNQAFEGTLVFSTIVENKKLNEKPGSVFFHSISSSL